MPGSLNKYLILFSFIVITDCLPAQTINFRSDIEHLGIKLSQKPPDPFLRPYIYQNEPSLIKKLNPVNIILGGGLFVYQNVLSRHFSADCLFTPSCSEFSKQAIKEYGLFKGVFMSIDRVNRCNRIAAVDLKRYSADVKSGRYSDPVLRYRKNPSRNEE
jgi:uncharacterized protein